MDRKKVPKRVWDFLALWICETANLSVSSSKYADSRTPIEIITGETPDISEYVDFGFYDWVIYRSNAGLGEPSVGRWIGVSHKVGQLMSYWILPMSGIPISCVNVQRLTEEEQGKEEYLEAMKAHAEGLNKRMEARGMELNLYQIPQWNRLSYNKNDHDFKVVPYDLFVFFSHYVGSTYIIVQNIVFFPWKFSRKKTHKSSDVMCHL